MNTLFKTLLVVASVVVMLAASAAFASWGWDRDAGAKGRGDYSRGDLLDSCFTEVRSCEPVAICECQESQEVSQTSPVQDAVAVDTANIDATANGR